KHLTEKESGWQVSARCAQADQLESFSINTMSRRMQQQAPVLSTLVGTLLDSDPSRSNRQERFSEQADEGPTANPTTGVDWDDEDQYWWDADLDMSSTAEDDATEEGDLDAGGVEDESEHTRKGRKAERSRKRLIIISIFMFSTNQKCNALPAVMGMFLHSTSAPELVVEVLAHAGLSVSTSTIHNMVDSLSHSVLSKIRALAKTRLFLLAYDNFDIDFKSYLATIEHPGQTLKHATSALMMPLEHEVMPEDTKYCDPLWNTNPMNP
ncbi:hypothetical protein BC629DRAFT_1263891, partial [Irpex lacteus]